MSLASCFAWQSENFVRQFVSANGDRWYEFLELFAVHIRRGSGHPYSGVQVSKLGELEGYAIERDLSCIKLNEAKDSNAPKLTSTKK